MRPAGGSDHLRRRPRRGHDDRQGKTVPLRHVSASIQQDPDDSDQHWLVVLVSDVAVAEADRSPSRLAALAAEGEVEAVRVVWREGFA